MNYLKDKTEFLLILKRIANNGGNPLIELYKRSNASYVLNIVMDIGKSDAAALFTDDHVLGFINELAKSKKERGINSVALNGNGILHLFPRVRVIERMANMGAKMNSKNIHGETPLAYFLNLPNDIYDTFDKYNGKCKDFPKAIIKAFLENGADPNKACAIPSLTGRLTVLEAEGRNTDENTKTTIELIGQSIKHGADINKDPHPLKIAENEDLIEALVKYGADPNGSTEIYLPDSVCVTQQSFTDYKSVPLLWHAIYFNDFYKTRLLLEHGADPNLILENGDPLLFVFLEKDYVRKGQEDYMTKALRLLVDYGMDLNAKDKNGNTILTRKFKRRKGDIPIDVMIDLGADAAYVAPDGYTPLHRTIERLESQSTMDYIVGYIKAVLNAGGDPNAVTNDGITPLALACTCFKSSAKRPCFSKQTYIEAFKTLVEAGADVEASAAPIALLPQKVQWKIYKTKETMEQQKEVKTNETHERQL